MSIEIKNFKEASAFFSTMPLNLREKYIRKCGCIRDSWGKWTFPQYIIDYFLIGRENEKYPEIEYPFWVEDYRKKGNEICLSF
jgi:hypothetical protein